MSEPTGARDGQAADESLITPAMQAAIGSEGEPVRVEISREVVRRMAEALDEDDPAILAAIDGDDPHPVVPSYALICIISHMSEMRVPDVPGHGLMAADDWTYLNPVRVGDRITVRPRVADIQERIGGRVGHSLFVRHEWICENQAGVEIARVRRTIAHYPERDPAGSA